MPASLNSLFYVGRDARNRGPRRGEQRGAAMVPGRGVEFRGEPSSLVKCRYVLYFKSSMNQRVDEVGRPNGGAMARTHLMRQNRDFDIVDCRSLREHFSDIRNT